MMLRPSSINQLTFSPLGALYAYLLSLPNQVIFIPLLDPVGTVNPVVYNPSVAKGRNIVVNPNFDVDANWSKNAGWTISAGAAHGLATTTAINQVSPLIIGLNHETEFEIQNIVSGRCQVILGNAFGTLRNANGIYSENLLPTSSSAFNIDGDNANPFTGDIDNAYCYALNIPANSMTATATGALARGDFWLFDGTGDAVNIYSNSLNSAAYLDEITINIFAFRNSQVGFHRIIRLGSASGRIDVSIYYNGSFLTFQARLNNIVVSVGANYNPGTAWAMYTMTISLGAGQMKAFINGVQFGTTQAFAQAQTENITTTQAVIGAGTSAGAQSWLGGIRLAQLVNGALTPATIANIYALSGL